MRATLLLLALTLSSTLVVLAPTAAADTCVGSAPTAAVCVYSTLTLPGCWFYTYFGGERNEYCVM